MNIKYLLTIGNKKNSNCNFLILFFQFRYNLSQVANSIGDVPLAYRCLKLAIASNPSHYEAWNNLGVMLKLLYKCLNPNGILFY